MNKQEQILNEFLVEIFNEILKVEENALKKGKFQNLSIREMHVIEAVVKNEKSNTNTSSNIAKSLNITPGTLTTGVNALEKKGYLKRQRDHEDKRVINIYSTNLGKEVEENHTKFHENMVKEMLNFFPQGKRDILIEAVVELEKFFKSKKKAGK
ncbi:MarR family transcriptional regulator [Anaerofustis sp.]|uniref:MarR family winged helix-turn-helix transcriptional regulator n=1 Tax=Anaerofustis sp. TaxID=1872517 RepID=UPI0025C46040|nr:MarR family transcriptional regulator [Anaerofustis sp.]